MRDKLIEDMIAKGYSKSVHGENVYLSEGCETILISGDGSVGVSNPAGNFKCNNIYDFIAGKLEVTTRYKIRD